MNKDNPNVNDDLREEYDLTSLKVRKFGRNRKSFAGHIVRLDEKEKISDRQSGRLS